MPSRIADNLTRVRQQIAEAAKRSGRAPSDVTLVAVTKYVSSDIASELVDAGCSDLGESRPQELWRKAGDLSSAGVRWHFVGHLQRNKAKRSLPFLSLLHSCDSTRLLAELDQLAAAAGVTLAGLLEVNVSGDASKHGFGADEMQAVIASLADYSHVRIQGLMSMASLQGDLDAARGDFERLRQLRDRLAENLPPGVSLSDLSMGMSRDFEVAIEEGATLVRVGSALFEGLDT